MAKSSTKATRKEGVKMKEDNYVEKSSCHCCEECGQEYWIQWVLPNRNSLLNPEYCAFCGAKITYLGDKET